MKIRTIIFIIIFIASYSNSFSSFYATRYGNYESWHRTQFLKFVSTNELYGLFQESTINLSLKLGMEKRWNGTNSYVCTSPTPGQYEFVWTFSLPKTSFIKELKVWDKNSNSYLTANPITLSSGEASYNSSKSVKTSVLLRQFMRRDYSGKYNLQYELRISPVNYDESAEFILKFISPCKMQYKKRIVYDYSSQFYTSYNDIDKCYSDADAQFQVFDYNNLSSPPQNYSWLTLNWYGRNNIWESSTDKSFSDFTVYFPEESANDKFLRTSTNSDLKFYQLTTKPQIVESERKPRNIILAFDLSQLEYNASISRYDYFSILNNAISISTTSKDSLAFVTSDFNVKWLDNNFKPRDESLIKQRLETVRATYPQLNTLPFMLKEIVNFVNEKKCATEVWVISDDFKTGVRAETVMDLLRQTYYSSKYKITFKIVDASTTYNGYYIQNKYYKGNEYLYENLTRLSGGSFEKLYNYYKLNYIDALLDCWAPTVSTVEIDPFVTSGFTYSRQNLNYGRNNFNITQRYFQYGIWEGSLPMNINFYGNFLGEPYFKTISLEEDKSTIPQDISVNTELYWYGNYILNDLFLQPQSYSTIKYIEELSVKERLITPYTAYVVPGPNGYIGFNRIYEADSIVSVKEDKIEKEKSIPTGINLTSYPNPFNPQTTITLKLSNDLLSKEKSLDIYDLLGQKVKSFNLYSFNNSAEIKLQWNGESDFGINVASGIYFAVFKCGANIKSLKLQLVR